MASGLTFPFTDGRSAFSLPAARLAFAAVLTSGVISAQSIYGTLTGTVTDQSSAIIREAKVEAVNHETKVKRSVLTDDGGRYRLVNLDPGFYTISATTPGFVTAVHKDVQLLAGREESIPLQLAVGSATTTVEVSGTPAVAEELTRSDSKSGESINSLALNFRATANPSPIVVANLAPGVQSDTGGNITIAGQLPTATSFSLDGVSTQLPRIGGPTRDLFPSVEGISEFRVNTAGNSAEFSQATDVTAISRSGTNDLHGGAFWYLQRKGFNSADQISKVVPTGDANTYGVSLGGPVFIPSVYNGKDKTFFFFDYEGISLDANTLISTNTPPTPWRTGNFASSGTTIIDPTNNQPFPGNIIPPNRFNSVSAKAIPLFFPAPTTSDLALANPNLVTAIPGSYAVAGFDGRFDHAFTPNHRVWGRVTQKTITALGTDAPLAAVGTGDAAYNPLMGVFSTDSDLTNIVASYDWIVRPDLINDLRFGDTRATFSFTYPQAGQGDSIVQSLGIQGLPGPPKNGLGGVPVFHIGDFLGGQTNPYGHPRINKNTTFEIVDNVSWTRGRHAFKFGFEFRRLSYQDNISFNLGDEYGDYFYNGSDATGFSTFLLGNIDDAVQAQNGSDGKPYGFHYGGFGQDEWRLRENVTLTVGLRYEINTPFNDETHQLGNFDPNYPGGRLVIQNEGTSLINPLWKMAVGNTPFVTASSVGLPDTLRYTYKKNFQPRVGLSWRPGGDRKTTVRGSFGVYSVPVMGAVLYSLLGVDTSYYADYGAESFPNAFPTGSGRAAVYPGYRRANQYNLKDPRVIQSNLSVDRGIGWNTVVRASYTGSHTYNLIYSPDLNQVAPNAVGYAALVATPALRQKNLKFPNFREVLTRDNGPSDKYNAFTLELNRRFSSDLMLSNNYTFAHNLTNALGAAPSSAIPAGGQGDNGNNVNNYFDIASDMGNAFYTRRHRFVNAFLYDLPIGRGKKYLGGVNRTTNLAVSGWRVTGIALLQSGPWLTPFFPSSLTDPSGTLPASRSVTQQRPDCVAGKTGYLSNPTMALYYDVTAFSVPASNIGRFGNCGVGILQGPGTSTFSMSAGKTFFLTERIGLQFESQFANLFNFLNRDAPNTNVASKAFGTVSQSQLVEQAGPRTIQLHLRLRF